MELAIFKDLKSELKRRGFGDDVEWSENLKACESSGSFVLEFIFVVCNSGMKSQIAQKIYERILEAIRDDQDISEAFGHKGKVKAMKYIIKEQGAIFKDFQDLQNDSERVEWCGMLPWIGKITKFHLAKNLGVDCAKPDRHLAREANLYGMSVEDLCQDLAEKSGLRVATVDVILWRAGNQGLLPYQQHPKERSR